MKSNRNLVLENILTAIGIAAVLLVLACVVFDIRNGGSFQMTHYAFSRMALGALAIGLGFGLPSFIYKNEALSLPVQTLIHMGIGCAVMTATGFLVGWIPTDRGAFAIVGTIAGEAAVAFAIWLLFYAQQKKLAKKMNRRITEKGTVNQVKDETTL